MNNDKPIRIKSLLQPDGGEGASEPQGVASNGALEKAVANMRGDEQEPSKASRVGTKPQHRTKSSIHYKSRSVDWALVHGKSVGLPRESQLVSLTQLGTGDPARGLECQEAVSRGHMSRRKRAGSSRRRVTRPAKVTGGLTATKARTVPRPKGSGK